jgi:hypothetical protein
MPDNLDALKSNPAVIHLFTQRMQLKRNGKEMSGNCVFHSEKTPSLRVWQANGGNFLYKCFGCGASGSVVDFVSKVDKISVSAAIKLVKEFIEGGWDARKEQVENVFKPFGEPESQVKKVYGQQEYARMETALQNNPVALTFLERERGITPETAKKLRLGYRQDVGRLAGEASADVAACGWIVFPTLEGGLVTSLKYRSIQRKAFCKQSGMATALWNVQSVDFLEPVFLVVGEFDACVLEQAGYRAVSLPGDNITVPAEWKDALLAAECVILAGDNDDSGQKIMRKLWAEMQERTFLLQWPEGVKDANALWDKCGRNLVQFRTAVDALVVDAKSRPMDGIRSLPEMMVNQGGQNVVDDPNRFRFPWANVDDMAILAPGSVVGVVATNTGMGKTSWVTQATIEAARKHGEIVLNYQAELTDEQFSRMATAQILRKHRLQLTKADFQEAARLLAGTKYYVGRNPVLNTIGPVLDLIEAGIRRLGATVVVLDNLHFLARYESDQVKAVENAMQRIKGLAAFHKLKWFVVGQPKKAEATSKGKALHISDVRGSASFGDDSDAVYALHREMVKSTDEDRRNDYKPETRVRLVKVRDKGTGDAEVDLVFLGELALFAMPAYNTPDDTLPFGEPR